MPRVVLAAAVPTSVDPAWYIAGVLLVGLISAVVAGIRAISSGRLVPGATVDRLTVANDKQVAELTRQYEARQRESLDREQAWKAAWEKAEAARQIASEQVDALLEYAETTDRFIHSLAPGAGVREKP